MSLTLTGQKKGMMQIFDDEGKVVVCTVIQVDPNPVVQIKRTESEGYQAVQLAGIPLTKSRAKNKSKPVKGHYAKANVPAHYRLKETRVDDVEQYQLGQMVDLSLFSDTQFVDVQAISKGKGFQGVMKLHGYAGGPAAHGSGFHRHAGSTGMRSTPGRCFPGGKRASRMGGEIKTVQSLKVVAIKGNLLLVKGAVPGARSGIVSVSSAVKKVQSKKK